MMFVRRLEPAANANEVPPEDGARLVRLLLQFDRRLTGGLVVAVPDADALTSAEK
jgi:hypothetical protein